jgi:beta-galactosidase
MEGKEIAVWVHSNLEKVELFLNDESLGAGEMKKDSHLVWNVAYVPGVLEARGFKDGELVMTSRRETTGAPAALAIYADRAEIAADGEDVAMFAIEVRDARGRIVPITDNLVTFKVTGAGKLIGVGNGDPTNQESDKGSSRKAFSGRCLGLVQSTKSADSITVEATSPGLTPAQVTIWAGAVTLRPQVAAWEREAPRGSGITGLWRPAQDGGTQLFVLHQDGNQLTGVLEAVGMGWAGGYDAPTPITDGRVDGSNVSFKAGNAAFSGRINGNMIELERTLNFGPRPPRPPAQPDASRPAVGPPPDGSDPSGSPLRRPPGPVAMVLHRVER